MHLYQVGKPLNCKFLGPMREMGKSIHEVCGSWWYIEFILVCYIPYCKMGRPDSQHILSKHTCSKLHVSHLWTALALHWDFCFTQFSNLVEFWWFARFWGYCSSRWFMQLHGHVIRSANIAGMEGLTCHMIFHWDDSINCKFFHISSTIQ